MRRCTMRSRYCCCLLLVLTVVAVAPAVLDDGGAEPERGPGVPDPAAALPSSVLFGSSSNEAVEDEEVQVPPSTTAPSGGNDGNDGDDEDETTEADPGLPDGPAAPSVKIAIDPTLDGRKEIAHYNTFMDNIYRRMNAAIRAKGLDPMDLKVMSTVMQRAQEIQRSFMADDILEDDDAGDEGDTPRASSSSTDLYNLTNLEEMNVKAWLHGMATLERTADVSVFFHEAGSRTIQCPFSLGPMELKLSRVVVAPPQGPGSSIKKGHKTKYAKAVTEKMLGLMDLRIVHQGSGKGEITDVVFDEPGGVLVQGNLKRRANTKADHKPSPYKLVLARRTTDELKKMARLVLGFSDL